MTLLRDIQDSAVDPDQPITSLLRKCKILAARLGNSEFKNWVEYELNGYISDDVKIPKYRIMSVASKGNFSGAFGRMLKNADIPLSCIPDEVRNEFSTTSLAHPISAIESLVKESNGGTVEEPWQSDITAILGQRMYQDMNCLQAWKVIPVNRLVGILDIVRNKVLSFVLEIEAEAPDAGDAPINSNPVPEEKVKQIFNTYITGSVQNVAAGSNHVKQSVKNNTNNTKLFEDLLNKLMNLKADEEITSQLTATVEEMQATQGTERFGAHYQNFMSILSDHMQVYGPVVAPFLPVLASISS